MRTQTEATTVDVTQFPDLLLEHYRYAPGVAETLAAHAHNEYQLGLSLNFPGEYHYRGRTYAVPVGSVSIIHPGELHTARDVEVRHVVAEFRMMYISPALMQRAVGGLNGQVVTVPFFATPILPDRSVVKLFLSTHRALTESSVPPLAQDELLFALVRRLIADYADKHRPFRSLTLARPQVLRARDYLHANATLKVTLVELAGVAGLSPFHFVRAFRREIGLPPHRYQMQVRIDIAKRLLAQGTSIAQVATDTGFYDQSHFGWHFRRVVGVTPARYRHERKNFLYTS